MTVRDEDNEVVGSSELSEGTGPPGSCTSSFVIDDVRPAEFYTVTIGSYSSVFRTRPYSHADLASMDWRLELTLGK